MVIQGESVQSMADDLTSIATRLHVRFEKMAFLTFYIDRYFFTQHFKCHKYKRF